MRTATSMLEFLNQWWQGLQAQSWLELIAVITAVLYLWLAIRENIWCWFYAFISTALSIYIFHQAALLSESLLNVFYLVMAVYGWYQWRGGQTDNHRLIQKWSLKKHLIWIVITALCVPVLGLYTQQYGAAYPFLDAFTSCFAVLTTILVAYKVFENWYYWLVIDSVSVWLFWQKELYFFTGLFVIYLIMVIIGLIQWSKSYDRQSTQTATH
ncbi:nicotinamide riboside transporter PnuC [Marinicella gelatinilytica]|uniref:nicotinamide riboside transporter PnuC n=1 Tax=Marinicella gelatinilytica TaxID=2996017 RepID=UPI0022609C18|nr:nicotinamide riboside transporter PnuC [Marinicella gelatinilytica]MCX7544138.1 nicotinamide riboside transporter PnuC [Marinicella gelatinilytica]